MTPAENLPPNDPTQLKLSESEWQDLRGLVHSAAGINLTDAKRTFLISRLWKRLRATRLATFRDYFNHVAGIGRAHEEHQQFINAVTTNKTEFFREVRHFELLAQWLSSESREIASAKARGLRIWCAAASTGEEPYTIAAVLQAVLPERQWPLVKIVASDIDTNVLATARRGVYDQSSVDALDSAWRSRMFVQGNGNYRGKLRVRRELRDSIQFVQENLVSPTWQVDQTFDLVFCRNVLIYFDRPTQERVVRRLLQRIGPHGLLFLGAAESIAGLAVEARLVASSVYARAGTQLTLFGAAEASPQCTFGKGQSRGQGAVRARRIERGEAKARAGGKLLVELDEAMLLVMHDPAGQRSWVAHVALDPGACTENAMHSCLARGRVELMLEDVATPLQAKLVLVSAHAAAVGSTRERVLNAAGRLGMVFTVTRNYRIPMSAWVEPATARIVLQKTASDVGPMSSVRERRLPPTSGRES